MSPSLRQCNLEETLSFLQSHPPRGDMGHMRAGYVSPTQTCSEVRFSVPLHLHRSVSLLSTHSEQEESRTIACGDREEGFCVDTAPEDPHQHFKTWWGRDWKLLWASIHTILPLLCPPKKDRTVIHPSLSRSYLYPVVGGFTSFA